MLDAGALAVHQNHVGGTAFIATPTRPCLQLLYDNGPRREQELLIYFVTNLKDNPSTYDNQRWTRWSFLLLTTITKAPTIYCGPRQHEVLRRTS